MEPSTISNVLGTWGYPALLLLLILTGIGSPIPEDLLLLTAGYLVYVDVFGWPVALAVCITGVVASDLMLYAAGRHLAWHSSRLAEGRLLSPQRLQRTTRWFGRLGNRLVFIARLLPGTRALVFVTAGVRGVPASSFLRYDMLGAALWVPSMLLVGYASGSRIGTLHDAVSSLNQSAAWVIALAGLLLVIWLSWGREESKL